MKRIIYHGSESVIKNPVFGFGNVHNDYGLGFYCTDDVNLAKEWAARKKGFGFVNTYQIRDDNLKILDLTKPPYDNVLYWVALLLDNRTLSSNMDDYPRELKYIQDNYLININEYDIIIGYRADDAYFLFPESFIRSEITLDSLNTIFRSGNLGKQYVILTKKAFSLIHFKDALWIENGYRRDYINRVSEAKNVYEELLKNDRYSNGVRLRDLLEDE